MLINALFVKAVEPSLQFSKRAVPGNKKAKQTAGDPKPGIGINTIEKTCKRERPIEGARPKTIKIQFCEFPNIHLISFR
jgi:hypothetical protein